MNIEYCLICLVNDGKQRISRCGKCFVPVHLRCYGEKQSRSPWFCDLCKAGHVDEAYCELCPIVGGVMRRTTTGKFIHAVCAITNSASADLHRLLFGELDTLPILSQAPTNPCYLCSDEDLGSCGLAVACESGFCKRALHASCAQRKGLVELERSHGEDSLHLVVSCEEHFNRECRMKNLSIYKKLFDDLKIRQSSEKPKEPPAKGVKGKQKKALPGEHDDIKLALNSNAEFLIKYRRAMSALAAQNRPASQGASDSSPNSKSDLDSEDDDIDYVKHMMEQRPVEPAFSVQFAAYCQERDERMRQSGTIFEHISNNYAKLKQENCFILEKLPKSVGDLLDMLEIVGVELPMPSKEEGDKLKKSTSHLSKLSSDDESEESSSSSSGQRTAKPITRRSSRRHVQSGKYSSTDFVVFPSADRTKVRHVNENSSSASSTHSCKNERPKIGLEPNVSEPPVLNPIRGVFRKRRRRGAPRVEQLSTRTIAHASRGSRPPLLPARGMVSSRQRRTRGPRARRTSSIEMVRKVVEELSQNRRMINNWQTVASQSSKHVSTVKNELKTFWQLFNTQTALEELQYHYDDACALGRPIEQARANVDEDKKMESTYIDAELVDSKQGLLKVKTEKIHSSDLTKIEAKSPNAEVSFGSSGRKMKVSVSPIALYYEDVPSIGMEVSVSEATATCSSRLTTTTALCTDTFSSSEVTVSQKKPEQRRRRNKNEVHVISLEDLD